MAFYSLSFDMALSKDKFSRQLERLTDDIRSKAHDLIPGGYKGYSGMPKVVQEFTSTFPNWSTFAAFERRFEKAAKAHPELEALRPSMEAARDQAAQISEIAAADKARKQAKREKAAQPKAELESGVKLEKANPVIVQTLCGVLAARRAAYLEEAVTHEDTLTANHLQQLREGRLNCDSDFIKARYKVWRNSSADAIQEALTSPTKCEARRQDAARVAGYSFDSYIVKLAIKVSRNDAATKVVTASVTGTVWQGTLTVETDVDHQVWNTKCILNRSPLGKAFNQWPTILVKQETK